MKSKIIIESESELNPISPKNYDLSKINNENFSEDLEKDLHEAIFRYFEKIIDNHELLGWNILAKMSYEIPIVTKNISDLGTIIFKITRGE